VGSMQVEGTISALNYGFRLITLPHGLIALALVQVAYPALGAAGAEDDRPAFRELLRRGLGTLGLLLLPIAAAAVVLREPVVALVYQRGSFDAEDLSLTADAVAFYSLGLVFLAWRELIARAFYSHGDARTPMVVALVAIAVNVAGDLTLGRAYGVAGLAGSTSLSFAVALVLLAVALERRFGSLHAGALARLGMRLTISAAAAAAPMWLALEALREAGVTSELLLVLVPAVLGGAAYVTVTRWLAPREVRELARAIRSIARR
jgi:putative peptidoglycan lipid II flippase